MLYSFKTAILSLQIKHKAFPFIETQKYCLSTSLEKFQIWSPLHAFLIKTFYNVFLFNLDQFSLITDNTKQLILEKCTHYIHSEHCLLKKRTRINFPKKYFHLTRSCHSSIQKQTKVNSLTSTMHIGRTLTFTTLGMKLYILLMWGDQYFKNTLQLKFRNNVKLTHVLAETLKISVNNKHCSSVGGLISKFPIPKLGDTCRIINNICWLLQAVSHSFEVNDHYLTKTGVIDTCF
jgi:hypothetical protein